MNALDETLATERVGLRPAPLGSFTGEGAHRPACLIGVLEPIEHQVVVHGAVDRAGCRHGASSPIGSVRRALLPPATTTSQEPAMIESEAIIAATMALPHTLLTVVAPT
jgi:hypothetical protein